MTSGCSFSMVTSTSSPTEDIPPLAAAAHELSMVNPGGGGIDAALAQFAFALLFAVSLPDGDEFRGCGGAIPACCYCLAGA